MERLNHEPCTIIYEKKAVLDGCKVFEYIDIKEIKNSNPQKVFLTIKENECICEYEGLEQGDTLYIERSWDGGIEFNYIRNIKYCPVCGRELPDEV